MKNIKNRIFLCMAISLYFYSTCLADENIVAPWAHQVAAPTPMQKLIKEPKLELIYCSFREIDSEFGSCSNLLKNRFVSLAEKNINIANNKESIIFSDREGSVFISTGYLYKIIRNSFIIEFGSSANILKAIYNIYAEVNEKKALESYDAIDNKFPRNEDVKKRLPTISTEILANNIMKKMKIKNQIPPFHDRLFSIMSFVASCIKFVIEHEQAHKELRHFNIDVTSCESLRNLEIEADTYNILAIKYAQAKSDYNRQIVGLANVLLGDAPGSFFLAYNGSSFSGRDEINNCEYPTSTDRLSNIQNTQNLTPDEGKTKFQDLISLRNIRSGGETR